jgi:hypothetical protein
MRALNQREKRTVQIAAVGVVVYLLVFFGAGGLGKLRARRAAYDALVAEAGSVKAQIAPYKDKAAAASKLMESFHIDPARLCRTSLVTEVSVALQKAATGGIQLGPIRETPNRSAGKEISSIQFEATGPLPPLLNLLAGIDTLGFPLVIDNVQIGGDPQRPGPLKLTLTILILDFDKWKTAEVPHA